MIPRKTKVYQKSTNEEEIRMAKLAEYKRAAKGMKVNRGLEGRETFYATGLSGAGELQT